MEEEKRIVRLPFFIPNVRDSTTPPILLYPKRAIVVWKGSKEGNNLIKNIFLIILELQRYSNALASKSTSREF